MEVIKTNIEGCFEIVPHVFMDKRGYFFESFNEKKFEDFTGAKPIFVQDNQSFSKKGVLRGLHFQKGNHAQSKLVRVLEGKVLDVAVDLRKGGKTYGNVVRCILSSENKKQLFIPRGCAHGFVTLSSSATFFYKCDNFYDAASEGGIIFNDSTLNIDWILNREELIVSERDLEFPIFDK